MKKAKILSWLGDMKNLIGLEFKAMWFNLGHHKIKFIPGMVGIFLDDFDT